MKKLLITSLMALLVPLTFSAGSLVAGEKTKNQREEIKADKNAREQQRDVVQERRSSRVRPNTNSNNDYDMPASLKAALRRTQGR